MNNKKGNDFVIRVLAQLELEMDIEDSLNIFSSKVKDFYRGLAALAVKRGRSITIYDPNEEGPEVYISKKGKLFFRENDDDPEKRFFLTDTAKQNKLGLFLTLLADRIISDRMLKIFGSDNLVWG